MKDYSTYSYWLESSQDDLTPRKPLNGSIEVDVAILGAGYSGLWTAYYLLKRDPSLNIAVIEQEIAGFGASGRNGGWCSAGFPVSLSELESRYGFDAARNLHQKMIETVDEISRVTVNESIDCDFEKGGSLRLARGKHQLPLIHQSLRTYKRFGFGDRCELLDRQETAERVNVTRVLGSIYTEDCATIHPGKLVRGLARVVERLGGTIYEQTRAIGFKAGPDPLLYTQRGNLSAKTIVLAGEAYLSRMDQLNRQLIPIYSLIVLTEPLDEEQWDQIGWAGREGIGSPRYVVDYLSKTADGRILFGGRGAPYHFGSRISDSYDRHDETHERLRRDVVEWFPAVRPDQFSHAWGGPLGVPRDWMPTMSYDEQTGIATARGYTGQGVATTNLSGRVLADLITCTQSELIDLPTVGHQSPKWEPEPMRYSAIRYIQHAYFRLDAKAEKTGRPSNGKSIAERLSRH